MVNETDTMITLPVAGELTFREWHALIDGVYCGVQKTNTTDYSKEKHYWRVGWLIGDAYDNKIR
jgi:hypothetical protein